MSIDKALKDAIRKLEGVSGAGGILDGTGNFIVYLEKDTPEVREAVLQMIGDKLPEDKVHFINTGTITAGS